MGFFKRLSGGVPEKKELTLEERAEKLRGEADASAQGILEKSRANCHKAQGISREIERLIAGLQEKDIAEQTAKGSQSVKDRFCKVSLQQMASVLSYQEGIGNASQIEAFIDFMQNAMLTLGETTQQQVAHLSFFFEEDIKRISRKAKEIDRLSKETRTLLKPLIDYRKLGERLERIQSLEAERGRKSRDLDEIENNILSLENSLKEIEEKNGAEDGPGELERLKAHAETAKAELESAESDAVSSLAVGKALRRYRHVTGLDSELINRYISDPREALVADSGLRIMEVLKDFLRMNEKNTIEDDAKKVAVIRQLVEHPDALKNKRKAIVEKRKGLESLQKEMGALLAPVVEKRKELEGRRISLEHHIREMRKQCGIIQNEITDIDGRMQRERQSI